MNKTLLPKLRFPEFQDEWKNEFLGNVYSFKVTNSFSRDQLNYENGSVKNIHYGDIHTKFSTLFDIKKEKVPFINPSVSLEKIAPESYCVEGDIVFADASEDLNDVGKSIEIVNVNSEKLVSGMHTLLARQKEKKITVGFGGYLFKSDRIRLQIKKEAQGAKVLGISANRLLNIDICYPSNKSEQQKIADCLTSLDDLITAQSQKVEALQVYKKGLMQNLFPAEGESVPRLRFPEFQSAGEWENKTLGELGEFKNGINFSADKKGNGILTVDVLNMYGEGTEMKLDSLYRVDMEAKDYLLEENDILFVRSSVKREGIGWAALFKGFSEPVIYCGFLIRLKLKSLQLTNPEFLLHYLRSDSARTKIINFAGMAAITNISQDSLKTIPVPLPDPNEQQRIAELLSTIDEEISAQGETVAALKVHKKGLMQQLFPSEGNLPQ